MARSYRSPTELFDYDAFRKAVGDYMVRWNWSKRTMADAAGIQHQVFHHFIEGRASSFLVVLSLAEICDLSIDKYRKPMV